MSRARLLFTVFLFLFCSPVFSTDHSQDIKTACQQLVGSLRDLAPPPRDSAYLRRRHPVIPWVGVTEEIVPTGQSLNSATSQEILARLEDVQKLLIQLRDSGTHIPLRLRGRLMETVAWATSAYYSSLNIPHSVEKFTTVLGLNYWRIKVNPQGGASSRIVRMANQLSSAGVTLQIDFNFLTLNRGAAAFEEGTETSTPVLDSQLNVLRELWFDPRTHSRLSLPFRMAYLPDAVESSVGVLHELRHMENVLRRLQKEDFPFYGAVFFPLGLKEFFDKEPEKSSSFVKAYGRYFSLDENDTTVENFFNLGRILDDPLASFNRELGEGSLEREFILDTQYLAMANRLSTAVGQAVLSELEKKESERKIEFTTKTEMVWAKVLSTLKPGVLKTGFMLTIPLVKVQSGQTKEEMFQALRKQMEFMMTDLQNRTKLIEWLKTADDLRNGIEFENKSYKDFLRVFLSALIHPGFSNQPVFKPLTWDRQSRAFRRATLGPRRR